MATLLLIWIQGCHLPALLKRKILCTWKTQQNGNPDFNKSSGFLEKESEKYCLNGRYSNMATLLVTRVAICLQLENNILNKV